MGVSEVSIIYIYIYIDYLLMAPRPPAMGLRIFVRIVIKKLKFYKI